MDAPVHDSLTVVEQENIYQNDEWWKAAVTYTFDDSDSTETAVYLWHNDDDDAEWTRKNKYVIKTVEAWATDKEIIESLLTEKSSGKASDEFPVSDYYNVATGVSVFQSDGWWKAIVNIDEKGSYETDEVMVYLWQERDGDWRRRQKYTIKDQESWEEERTAIESVLEASPDTDIEAETSSADTTTGTATSETTSKTTDPNLEISDEVADLDAELDDHLSETLD